MNMLEEKVLGIIEKNSRVSTREMAVVLGTEEIDVINALQSMEEAGIICGYHTMIDWDKTDIDKVTALIEVRVTPQRGKGFDDIAERIYKYPEVQSVFEWSGCQATIIENEAEADALDACKRLGVVCQTTFSTKKFSSIINHLLDKGGDIRIVRTICTATEQRQSAARELAGNVDVMIVIGGRNSANTTRLAQVCAEKCKTYHIETAEELQPEWLENIEKIGITAGASTPDWIIKEVYNKCQKK